MANEINSKAFLYCRVSTEEQEKGYSLNAQLDRLREYCKGKFEIVGEIKTHESAKEEGRKHFNEMMARVEAEKIGNVIVYSTDRLSRNADDVTRVKKLIRKGVQFHLVNEGQILTSDDFNGEYVFMIKSAGVERDNRQKGADTKKGLDRKFREGKWIGYAPIGYLNLIKEGGERVVILDPERADKVKQLFEAYDTGRYSLRQLAKFAEKIGLRARVKSPEPLKKPWDEMTEEEQDKWNEKEKKRKKERPLSVSGIAKILSSNFYIGKMKMKGMPNEGVHPAIVSIELWESVQRRLKEARRNMVAERRPNDTFPFKQFTRCGYCGGKITAGRTMKELKNGESKMYNYYHCAKQKNPECPGRPYTDVEMEELVSSGIKNINVETEVFERLRREIEKTNIQQEKVNKKELNKLRKEEGKEKAKIEMLYEDRLAGRISAELYDKKVKEVEERLAEIRAEITEVEGKLNDKWKEQSLEAVTAFVKMGDRFSKLDAKGKARVLDGVLEKCLLKGDKITFVWRQPWAAIFEYSEEIEQLADDVGPEDSPEDKGSFCQSEASG